MSETFWVAFGSIGTTLAFGGVVWQGYLTPGTLKVNQLMTADATRSRLDSQASCAMTVPQAGVGVKLLSWAG